MEACWEGAGAAVAAAVAAHGTAKVGAILASNRLAPVMATSLEMLSICGRRLNLLKLSSWDKIDSKRK